MGVIDAVVSFTKRLAGAIAKKKKAECPLYLHLYEMWNEMFPKNNGLHYYSLILLFLPYLSS